MDEILKGDHIMDKLEKFWRDAPGGFTVCSETRVTKNMVLNAIIDGAKDLEMLKAAIPLCSDDTCASNNPSGEGCSENARVLLSIYAPVYEFMKEGHSHDHEHDKGCGNKPSASCGSCKLCQ